MVNCRIGSLESITDFRNLVHVVNCRIGSLENFAVILREKHYVNCRIGSLEKRHREIIFLQ